MSYQPHKMTEEYIHGCTLLRPIPTNPTSLMCKIGLHNLSEFDTSKAGRSWQKYGEPTYCTRCSHSNWGNIIPRRPPYQSYVTKSESLLSKAATIARELQKLDDLKGYMESRESQLRKELDEIIGSPDYPASSGIVEGPPITPSGIREVRDGIPRPPIAPTPPSPRIIRENGRPPGNE